MTQSRLPNSTVAFIDHYCAAYQKIFPEVRSYEAFKRLHLGMVSEINRKTLPAIAKTAGLKNEQSLLHFLTNSPWNTQTLKEQRLAIILQLLRGRKITLIIEETGDKKKGKTTDYVARQYMGNLGKIENGIISVNAYGVIDEITFPILSKIYKPKTRLKESDVYKDKTQLASEIIMELQASGFEFEVVLANSIYGENESFFNILNKLNLKFIIGIKTNQIFCLPYREKFKSYNWQEIGQILFDEKLRDLYIREIVFDQQSSLRYWQITTDTRDFTNNLNWYFISNLLVNDLTEVSYKYRLKIWLEYRCKQFKNSLGWADFRCTDCQQIERWWEIVSSAYLMVSLQLLEQKEFPYSIDRDILSVNELLSDVEISPNQDLIIITHGGVNSYRPEHTLAAYESAVELESDYIEPDLVSTKDGVLVARHENGIPIENMNCVFMEGLTAG